MVVVQWLLLLVYRNKDCRHSIAITKFFAIECNFLPQSKSLCGGNNKEHHTLCVNALQPALTIIIISSTAIETTLFVRVGQQSSSSSVQLLSVRTHTPQTQNVSEATIGKASSTRQPPRPGSSSSSTLSEDQPGHRIIIKSLASR